MASANQIRINTGIDTKAISQGLSQVKRQIDDLFKGSEARQELANYTKYVESELDKIQKKIDETSDNKELANLNAQKKAFEERSKKTIESYNQEINAENEKISKLQEEAAQLEYQRDLLSGLQAERTRDDLSDTLQSSAIYQKNIQLLEQEIEIDKKKYGVESDIVKELQKELEEQKKLKGLADFNEKKTEDYGKNIKTATARIEDHNKGLNKCVASIKRMSLAIFGASSAYAIVRKIINEATKDNEKLSNTIKGFWGSLGALFEPVLNFLIQGLSTILNYAMMIIQTLTGINMLAKAQKSIAGNGDKSLLSFDKINKLSDKGGGTDSYLKAVELSAKLEEVLLKIRTYIQDIVSIVEEWWNALDFQPLLDSFSTIGEAFEKLLGVLGEGFKWVLENVLLPLGQWTIEEAVPRAVELLASAIDTVRIALEVAAPYLEEIWNVYLKPIAEFIGGVLLDVLDWLKEKLDALNDWMEKNPETAGKVVTAALLIAAALAVVVPVVEKIIDKLKETKDPVQQAASDFSGFFDSIGNAVETIAILGGIALALNGLASVIDSISGLMRTLSDTSMEWYDILGALLAILVPFGAAIALIVAFAPEIAVGLGLVGIALAPLALTLPPILDAIGRFIDTMAEPLVKMINAITEAVERIGATIIDVVESITDAIIRLFNEVLTPTYNTLKTDLSSLINFIVQMITSARNTIANIVNAISTTVGNVFKTLRTTLTSIFNGIWSTIRSVINSILGGVESMANGVVRGINRVIDALNGLSFKIPDWVPVLGGNRFGFNISHIGTVSLPRLATGGIIQPIGSYERSGLIATRPTALVGEAGAEGVLPLTNQDTMSKLGQEIAKWVTVNINMTNEIDGRVLSKRLETIRNNNKFAMNGGGM